MLVRLRQVLHWWLLSVVGLTLALVTWPVAAAEVVPGEWVFVGSADQWIAGILYEPFSPNHFYLMSVSCSKNDPATVDAAVTAWVEEASIGTLIDISVVTDADTFRHSAQLMADVDGDYWHATISQSELFLDAMASTESARLEMPWGEPYQLPDDGRLSAFTELLTVCRN